MKYQIGIDIDGVLADFILGFTTLMQELYPEAEGIPFPTSLQQTWNFEDGERAITGEMVARTWDEVSRRPNWWVGLPPLALPSELSDLILLEGNHEVTYITARYVGCGASLTSQARAWLGNYGLRLGGLVVTRRKGAIAKALKLDYFLDDNVPNCEEVDAASPQTRVYVRAHPYNRDTYLPRVDNLGSFLSIVEAGHE